MHRPKNPSPNKRFPPTSSSPNDNNDHNRKTITLQPPSSPLPLPQSQMRHAHSHSHSHSTSQSSRRKIARQPTGSPRKLTTTTTTTISSTTSGSPCLGFPSHNHTRSPSLVPSTGNSSPAGSNIAFNYRFPTSSVRSPDPSPTELAHGNGGANGQATGYFDTILTVGREKKDGLPLGEDQGEGDSARSRWQSHRNQQQQIRKQQQQQISNNTSKDRHSQNLLLSPFDTNPEPPSRFSSSHPSYPSASNSSSSSSRPKPSPSGRKRLRSETASDAELLASAREKERAQIKKGIFMNGISDGGRRIQMESLVEGYQSSAGSQSSLSPELAFSPFLGGTITPTFPASASNNIMGFSASNSNSTTPANHTDPNLTRKSPSSVSQISAILGGTNLVRFPSYDAAFGGGGMGGIAEVGLGGGVERTIGYGLGTGFAFRGDNRKGKNAGEEDVSMESEGEHSRRKTNDRQETEEAGEDLEEVGNDTSGSIMAAESEGDETMASVDVEDTDEDSEEDEGRVGRGVEDLKSSEVEEEATRRKHHHHRQERKHRYRNKDENGDEIETPRQVSYTVPLHTLPRSHAECLANQQRESKSNSNGVMPRPRPTLEQVANGNNTGGGSGSISKRSKLDRNGNGSGSGSGTLRHTSGVWIEERQGGQGERVINVKPENWARLDEKEGGSEDRDVSGLGPYAQHKQGVVYPDLPQFIAARPPSSHTSSSSAQNSPPPSTTSNSIISPRKPTSSETAHGRPGFTYCDLAAQAIFYDPEGQVPIRSIYEYIGSNYPYYGEMEDETGWQNSIRHALSINKKIFIRQSKEVPVKGGLWTLAEEARGNFVGGKFDKAFLRRMNSAAKA